MNISIFVEPVIWVWSFMTLMFIIAVIEKDNGIADIAWGMGFILVAYMTLPADGVYEARQILVSALVTLWGVRLAGQIYLRNLRKGEDFRYKKWRKEWKHTWIWRSYLQVFMLQGLIMLIISFPVIFVNNYSGSGLTWLDYIAAFLWLVGFYFEAVSDYQMYNFKKNKKNKGKIMTSGLWQYSRHPNYFGECLMWWSIFLIALSVPGSLIVIIAPLLLTFLLLKVSGVPTLEAKWKGNKQYEKYKKTTNAFIPGFPKS